MLRRVNSAFLCRAKIFFFLLRSGTRQAGGNHLCSAKREFFSKRVKENFLKAIHSLFTTIFVMKYSKIAFLFQQTNSIHPVGRKSPSTTTWKGEREIKGKRTPRNFLLFRLSINLLLQRTGMRAGEPVNESGWLDLLLLFYHPIGLFAMISHGWCYLESADML